MTFAAVLAGFLFATGGLVCTLLTAVGLPGTWLLIGFAGFIEVLGRFWPAFACLSPGLGMLVFGGVLALGGEILETLAGAAGSRAGGGSRRGMVGAILGGLIGGLLLTGLIPIPLLGTLIGAIIGTFAGAGIAELSGPESAGLGHGLRAALWATLGRLAGTFGKTMVAVALWLAFTFAASTACG